MSGNGNGAYELKHCGKIHRASGFDQLKNWVMESRVTAEDSFRPAGSREWTPVLEEPEFASILDPDNQWVVTMSTGVFKTFSFETVVKWAAEGRITDDAVVEGPRTPPGGVKANALPALASDLREPPALRIDHPLVRIDGREFPAADTETIRKWIKESRVPVEAEISLKGKNWEPVSSCGLFDLEDWPAAAHGRIEEKYLPQMPEEPTKVFSEKQKSAPHEHEEETAKSDLQFSEILDVDEEDPEEISEEVKTEEIPYTVVSNSSEMTIESVKKIRSLLKKEMIFSYDEIKHPSITEETLSVGEYLDSLRSPKKGPIFWLLLVLLAGVVTFAVLEYFGQLDFFTWL
ncbi:MAG: hypothetical protein U9P42_03430 [Candidatus Fermentibacteria bacterium]|nr:hypothetical protein [Candidatus Fermentibacteria bacterium]